MILARRSFLTGLGSMLAAPAIVHAGNLMPVRSIERFSIVLRVDPAWEGPDGRTIFRTVQAAVKAAEQYKDVTIHLEPGAHITGVSLSLMPQQRLHIKGLNAPFGPTLRMSSNEPKETLRVLRVFVPA